MKQGNAVTISLQKTSGYSSFFNLGSWIALISEYAEVQNQIKFKATQNTMEDQN